MPTFGVLPPPEMLPAGLVVSDPASVGVLGGGARVLGLRALASSRQRASNSAKKYLATVALVKPPLHLGRGNVLSLVSWA